MCKVKYKVIRASFPYCQDFIDPTVWFGKIVMHFLHANAWRWKCQSFYLLLYFSKSCLSLRNSPHHFSILFSKLSLWQFSYTIYKSNINKQGSAVDSHVILMSRNMDHIFVTITKYTILWHKQTTMNGKSH